MRRLQKARTHGTVYLGNTTTDSTNPVPTPGAVDITTASGSMVWKIGDMAAGEIRTLTYYVKLKDNVGLNDNEIKNKQTYIPKLIREFMMMHPLHRKSTTQCRRVIMKILFGTVMELIRSHIK